jgi:hypothetical protein
MKEGPQPFKLTRPTVYIDQWVWIRLAKANAGDPMAKDDLRVLTAVRDAAASGVCFPLSVTHYQETIRIRDARQRQALTEVMAPISQMQTFRAHNMLLRHQFLVALHETVGRPTFRPREIEVIGIGMHWAFTGAQVMFKVVGADGQTISSVGGAWLRQLNQHAEAAMLAGPKPWEVPHLLDLGYVDPRELEEQENSRVDYEQWLTSHIAGKTTDADELRALVMSREIGHEYSDLVDELFMEFRVSWSSIVGGSRDMTTRPKAIAFAERIPTLRISADLKVHVFRNKNRNWSWNMLRDIDALSIAVPYCHIVIADKDAVALLDRTGADRRHQTIVTASIKDLPDLLEQLSPAESSNRTDWDELGPDDGKYHLEAPAPLSHEPALAGASVRLFDTKEHLVLAPRPVSERET